MLLGLILNLHGSPGGAVSTLEGTLLVTTCASAVTRNRKQTSRVVDQFQAVKVNYLFPELISEVLISRDTIF